MIVEPTIYAWMLALGGIGFALVLCVIDMGLVTRAIKRLHLWHHQRYIHRYENSLPDAPPPEQSAEHINANVVVQHRTADVAMADLSATLREVGASIRNAAGEPPAPPPDRTAGGRSIIGGDFAEAERRVLLDAIARSDGLHLDYNHGTPHVVGDAVDYGAMSHHETFVGRPDMSYEITVAPHPPLSSDPEDEECDLWINTGTKPATFVFPDDGEWSEVAALRMPLRGASVTINRKDDVYVTITTTVAPGFGTHLEELETLRVEQRVFWEHMSPELTTWLGGMTQQERTFVLSLIGVSAPEGNVPRLPGKRPARDIDLG